MQEQELKVEVQAEAVKVAHAKKEAPKAKAKAEMVSKEVAAPKSYTVTPKVNMMCKSGVHLEVGKSVELDAAEFDRLSKDERGPFFEV